MNKLFVANWKMHGDAAFAAQWAADFRPPPECDVAVCPPFPYLQALRAALPAHVAVGAQTLSAQAEDGAHTGEVSARMLADAGCEYVLVGHSERRPMGEDGDACATRVAAAAAAGLTPVLCVGETAEEFSSGRSEEAVLRQLQELSSLPAEAPCAVAYEPVWAIGSGRTPDTESLSRMRERIRAGLISQTGAKGGKIRILYGGSVKAENAGLPGRAGMDGALAGGASLDAAVFAQICRAGGT